MLGVTDILGVIEIDAVIEGVMLTLGVIEIDSVIDAVIEGVIDGVAELLGVTVTLGVIEIDSVIDAVIDGVIEELALIEIETIIEEVTLGLIDIEGVTLFVIDIEGVTDAVCVGLTLVVGLNGTSGVLTFISTQTNTSEAGSPTTPPTSWVKPTVLSDNLPPSNENPVS